MDKMDRREFIRLSIKKSTVVMTGSLIGSRSSNANPQKLTINVGYLPIVDHLILPVSYSLHKESYGFRVRLHLCRSWDEIERKVDIGVLQAAFLLAPLAMYKSIYDTSYRCVLFGHRNGSVISSKKDITGAVDLAGKTVGIPHYKSTHKVLLYKYLIDNNVSLENVKLQEVAPQLSVKSLRSGKIDAYVVAEPWGIKGVNSGDVILLEMSKNIIPDHICCILVMKEHFIQKNLSAVSEWIKSLILAGNYIHENIDDASEIQKSYMEHNPAEIKQVIKKNMISYKNLTPDKKALTQIQNLALDCGVMQRECNINMLLDNSITDRL